MKKINFFAGFFALLLCVGFTSCDDDDDNNAEGAGTDNVFPEGTKKVATTNDGYETTTFNYSDGKLISVKSGQNENITFEYSGNAVIMTSVYTGGSQIEKTVYTLNIGSNGFATNGTATYTYGNEKESGNFSFAYSGGYLTAINTTGEEGYDNYKITWENGNITRVVNEYRFKDEDGEDSGTYTTTATYDGNLNVANISFFDELVDLDELEYAYYAGLLGKTTKNLLKSKVETGDSSPYTTNYTYELDANGYPISITENDYSKTTYTYK